MLYKSKYTLQRLKILTGGIFFFFLLIQTSVSAQETPSRAFATLDSNVVTIGDKVVLHVGVEHDVSARIISTTPDMPVDTSIFDALNLGQWGDEKMRLPTYGRTIVFQAFDTGLFRIPSVVFTLAAANGIVTTVQSPTMLLTVNNPNGVDALVAPVDIKPIVATEWTFEEDMLPFLKEYVPYFILVLALGFLAWRYWAYRKNRENPPVIAQISQPAYIIAERLLAALRAKQLWQNGKTKEYYSELSHILRGYLDDQFKLPALETTTDELMSILKKRGFDADILEKTQKLLQTADLVKFAKVEPSTHLHDDFLSHAEEIVAITKPKEQEIIN
ncbi:MAG: hypothetical protein U5L45_07410 [Saprospiraceae bacterium]|nr:hypothetical protein [Saprospiraceae bacterium]